MFLCDPPVFNNKRVMAQWKFYTPLPTLPSKTDITRFDGRYVPYLPTYHIYGTYQSLTFILIRWYGTVPYRTVSYGTYLNFTTITNELQYQEDSFVERA